MCVPQKLNSEQMSIDTGQTATSNGALYACPLSNCTSSEPLTVDALMLEIRMLPPDICGGDPADVQVASTFAADVIAALNAPVGGFARKG